MEDHYMEVRPCKTSAMIEGIPRKKMAIGMKELAMSIHHPFVLIKQLSVLCLLREEDLDIRFSIFKSGKVLIYTKEQQKAKRLLNTFVTKILCKIE